MKGLIVRISAIVLIIIFLGCMFMTGKNKDAEKAVDYSNSEHWLALPSSAEKNVDVFYLYPTSWQKNNKNDPNICEIDNPSMLQGSKLAFKGQATAFDTVANIYAPYYRQVDAVYTLSLSLEEQNEILQGIPKTEVFAAFDYYIKNYNNNRPFILAGHSQGSNVMLYLLSQYMKEHPEVYKRMIAAYVIGYSITEDYLAENPHLKFAQGPNDTGVIISYNTEASNITGNNPILLANSLVINPISWTRGEELATANESLGAFLEDEKGSSITIEHYADAKINKERGSLICSTCDVDKYAPGNPVFGRGIFHVYDYSFYYFDLRKNAENRIKNFNGFL